MSKIQSLIALLSFGDALKEKETTVKIGDFSGPKGLYPSPKRSSIKRFIVWTISGPVG